MTMQRMERFQYRGEDYALAAIEGFDDFHLPEPLRRLPFREPDTSLHRGFVSTFSLNARHQFIVHDIDAWVSPEATLPVINGIAPVFCYCMAEKEESKPPESDQSEEDRSLTEAILEIMRSSADDNVGETKRRTRIFSFPKKIAYYAIDVPLSYTGRILIGRNPLPYLRGGYVPPFYYQEVLELRFTDGYLIGANDVSAEANCIRQSIEAQTGEIRNDPDHRLIAIPIYALSEYSLDLCERWTDRVFVFSANVHEETHVADDAAGIDDADDPEQRETDEGQSPADTGDWGTYWL